MKYILSILILCASAASGQTPIYIPHHENTTAPAVQLDVKGDKLNLGLLITTEKGVGLFSAGLEEDSVGIWAVGNDGADALRVQGDAKFFDGSIEKEYTPGNILKIYDKDTGELLGEYEFEIVVE